MAKPQKTVRYFIVNPAGALHEATRGHAKERLQNDPRYRMATTPEIKKYFSYLKAQEERKAKGLPSRSFAPVADAYEAPKDIGVDVDALMEAAQSEPKTKKAE